MTVSGRLGTRKADEMSCDGIGMARPYVLRVEAAMSTVPPTRRWLHERARPNLHALVIAAASSSGVPVITTAVAAPDMERLPSSSCGNRLARWAQDVCGLNETYLRKDRLGSERPPSLGGNKPANKLLASEPASAFRRPRRTHEASSTQTKFSPARAARRGLHGVTAELTSCRALPAKGARNAFDALSAPREFASAFHRARGTHEDAGRSSGQQNLKLAAPGTGDQTSSRTGTSSSLTHVAASCGVMSAELSHSLYYNCSAYVAWGGTRTATPAVLHPWTGQH
ncbi:hypothetical protein BKA93DRAFT_754594 [Sparassis latifolia]